MRLPRERGSVLRTVVVPAAALVLAILVRAAADPLLGDTLPLVTVFGAVAAAVWSGGWPSATAVTVVGYVVAHWCFIAPRYVWNFADPAIIAGTFAFAGTSGLVIWFGEQARRKEQALRQSQQALAERVDVLDQALAELHDREAVFRTIGEAVPDFLWLADGDGRPVHQNPAWSRYFGLDLESFRAVSWETLHAPEDVPALKAAWDVARRNGEPFAIDTRLRRRDGALRWFHCRTVPLHDANGAVQKWVGTMTDIHDLKLAEAELHESARRKDEFMALLSHELRNPLAPLRSALDVLRLRGTASAETTALYALMERQVAQLVRLVDDLLDISRITSGTLRLMREVVVIGDVLESALETIAPQARQAGHQLAVDIDDPAARVAGDPVRLTQIVVNLLTNAIRYTPRGGRIALSSRTTREAVAITIADNGVGIAACDLPHLFEMFTRGQNAHAVRDGLGVGLTLAARLAAAHGGHIEALSDGVGHGSTFTIHLPAHRGSGVTAPRGRDGDAISGAQSPTASVSAL